MILIIINIQYLTYIYIYIILCMNNIDCVRATEYKGYGVN